MPTIVNCSSCARKLRVPDQLLGKRVKCPDCGNTFEATPPPSEPPPAPPPPPPAAPFPAINLSLEEGPPSGPAASAAPPPAPPPPPAAPPPYQSKLETCPTCGALVSGNITHCNRCGNRLPPNQVPPWEQGRRAVRRDCEPHRGTLVLVLGILSLVFGLMFGGFLGLPLGIAAWIMGHRDLAQMREGHMDPEGFGITQGGWICGIIGTIISSLMSLLCCGYFGFIFWMWSSVPIQ